MLPKIAVFGTNPLASALISELQRLNFEILGLWDQTLTTAAAWCDYFHIPVPSDSIEELLKNQEVDLILVCAPPHFHKEITTKALAAGKHVMCEPPLGLTGSDNAAIMELAVYYPSLTLSTFGLRYLSGVKRAKQLIENGEIGKVQSFEVSLHCGPADLLENLSYNWTCIGELCAGPLFSTAVHLVDLMTFLSGKRVYTVCGTVKRFQKNPPHFKYDQHLTREDFITWQGLLEGNIPCTTVINNNFPGKFQLKFNVTGATGSLILEDGNLYSEKPGQSNKTLESPLLNNDQSINQPNTPKKKCDGQSTNQATTTINKQSDGQSTNQASAAMDKQSDGQTTNQPETPMRKLYDYRHPLLVVAGVVTMCRSLKEAFEPVTERRRWSPKQLVGAATFRDCQYARAVVDAVKKSSESRKWTEVRIPTKALDGGSLTISLTRFNAT